MGVAKLAAGVGLVALLAGQGLADPARRSAFFSLGRTEAAPAVAPAAPLPRPAPPSSAPVSIGGAEVLAANRYGQFQTAVEIEGRRIDVLVDTGATFVALSYEDADRLGIRPFPSDYRIPMNTANGLVRAAAVTLRSVRLGGIEVRDVPAIVSARGQMAGTLLGMSFLSRLSTVRIDGGRLLLAP